jgi:hypothetical protein
VDRRTDKRRLLEASRSAWQIGKKADRYVSQQRHLDAADAHFNAHLLERRFLDRYGKAPLGDRYPFDEHLRQRERHFDAVAEVEAWWKKRNDLTVRLGEYSIAARYEQKTNLPWRAVESLRLEGLFAARAINLRHDLIDHEGRFSRSTDHSDIERVRERHAEALAAFRRDKTGRYILDMKELAAAHAATPKDRYGRVLGPLSKYERARAAQGGRSMS